MLTAKQAIIDLGKVRINQPYNFKYYVTNETNEPVRIKKLSVSCGRCTQASVSKGTVDANSDVVVTVVFTPESTGMQSKTITLHMEQGTITKDLKLRFVADV